ncbi:MAG: DUF308 domain-containing protein [Christensenella sp.]|uniref:DUF308 domain-containing protein n=1 Tax=Christensenella sp. TaxID=1935934 RepID=UPI002B2136A1|nr:DUF308 domain-containing protein [Christensenella sp.]MEA5004116.1 DUF308 domain-containing protein [Christensenella sp.]
MNKLKIAFTVIFSSILLAGGIFLAVYPVEIIGIFGRALGVLLTVFGGLGILFFLFTRDNRPNITAQTLVIGIVSLACGIVLLAWPGLIDQVVRITMLVWLFFTGGVQLLVSYSYYLSAERRWGLSLLWGGLLMAGFVVVLTSQDLWVFMLSTFIAAYCILLGLAGFLRLFLIVNQKNKNRKNIPLPFWMEVFLPKATLVWIQSSLDEQSEEEGEEDGSLVTSGKIEGGADIEILIHMSDLGTNALGHVDVVVDGQVFSYGNYDHDKAHIHLFGLFWDGVFAICEREKYIRFSLDSARKTIIGYQLALSLEDEQRLKTNIADFLRTCVPWKPEEPKKNGYANALLRQGAQLFKVSKGKYKTYFMLNTNCALLLEDFLEGTSIPKARVLGGIMTPGSLLSMFENELKRPGSPVTARTLYVSDRMASQSRRRRPKKALADLEECIECERNNQGKK